MAEKEIVSPLQPDEKGKIVEKPVEEQPELDLDALRDEKCFPVARTMFNDLVTDMMPLNPNEKVDYTPVLTKLLAHSVDADLNLVTENPYVFQLMLGMLTGLNKTLQECDTVPVDDVRYATIVNKMLAIVAEANVRIGSVTPEETTADFAVVKEKLNALFKEENLSRLEIDYIKDSMFAAFQAVQQGFSSAVDSAVVKVEEKLLGIEAMSDLTMKMIIDAQEKLKDS
jgi:hypothetical protein